MRIEKWSLEVADDDDGRQAREALTADLLPLDDPRIKRIQYHSAVGRFE